MIVINSGKMIIENTTINKASVSSYGKGGAIRNKGDLNISKSSIINCDSSDSGAISNDGTLNINSTLFEKCSASEN